MDDHEVNNGNPALERGFLLRRRAAGLEDVLDRQTQPVVAAWVQPPIKALHDQAALAVKADQPPGGHRQLEQMGGEQQRRSQQQGTRGRSGPWETTTAEQARARGRRRGLC